MKVGKAVAEGIINNETLGYFLVRVHMFLIRIGINPNRIRFRQHLLNEMAHYASDCWDAEVHTSYGWIECVGNADRACFDLTVHEKATGKTLSAYVVFPEGAREEDVVEFTVDKGSIGKKYRNDAKNALQYLDSIKENQLAIADLKSTIEEKGQIEIEGIIITKTLIQFKKEKKKCTWS